MPTLHWINKEKIIKESKKIPYKLLKENKDFSYGNVESDNMIIQGDNLDVLKSLLPYYSGQVKCIYIDPPYNTGNAFEYYNDNLEHSIWLNMMYPRLQLMRELLAEDGVIFVQIDDEEEAYLKVMMDEVFGRDNFINLINVKAKSSSGASGGGEDKKLKKNIEYLISYSKSEKFNKFNDQYREIPLLKYIENLDDEGKGFAYTSVLVDEGDKEYFNSTCDGKGEEIKIYKHINYIIKSVSELAKIENITKNDVYIKYFNKIFTLENAQTSIRDRVVNATDLKETFYSIKYFPISGKNKGNETEVMFYGKTKRLVSFLKGTCIEKKNRIYKRLKIGTLWDDLSWSSVFMEGDVSFSKSKKPESLIKRVLYLSTQPHDLILDSFLGSGTTCAVAHKMNRRYIGIEMGEHCITHVVPRLRKVIDGIDQGGISKNTDVDWKGGGSFKFYELGDTIFDDSGKIRKSIDFNTLANHIWFSEIGTSSSDNNFNKNIGSDGKTALLGLNSNIAYFLLYNGILKDKRPEEGNVLTHKVFEYLMTFLKDNFDGNIVIYGDSCKLRKELLEKNRILFKQIPYEIKGK